MRGISRCGVALLVLTGTLCCQSASAAPQSAEPPPAGMADPTPIATTDTRLLVVVVVDQLRADLLDRFDPAFTGGLRRLLERGHVFTNATHDHAHTETSPGHASISTGTYPSRHGMVSNQWYEGSGDSRGLIANVVHDGYVELGDTFPGAGAPVRLERTGLADWMLAQNPDTRVLSVSGKDRSAVLLAGKSLSPVFWFSAFQGRFVTSSYYGDQLPGWVDDFNREDLARYLPGDSVWESSVPPEHAHLSRPDTAAMEGDGVHTWFPHLRPSVVPGGPVPWPGEWLETIPELDRAVLDLARKGVEELDLGEDDTPDFLGIGLSQTDRVGHAYGPLSREQLDNLMRLDAALGQFLDFLDDRVGEDRYTVVLSADHGVMEMPEYRVAEGEAGRRLGVTDRRQLEGLLGEIVRQVQSLDPERVAGPLAQAAPQLDWIERAWTITSLLEGAPGDSITTLFQRSMYPGRSPGLLGRYGVAIQMVQGALDWGRPLGTTHGSPYYYDRHVPLIFMGPGVSAGRSDTRAATIDVAPTLAAWAGIRTPADLDGRTLAGAGLPDPPPPR